MQPVGPALPELDPVEAHAIPHPVRGPGHPLPLEPLLDGRHLGLEGGAAVDRLALAAGPGPDLGAPRARGEIGVRLIVVEMGHPTLDTYLAEQRVEVQQQRRPGFGVERPAFAAVAVGVEDGPPLVEALEEHDPGRGPAVGVDGGQGHRVRVAQVGPAGVVEPALEGGQGFGGWVVEVHAVVRPEAPRAGRPKRGGPPAREPDTINARRLPPERTR